MTSHCSSFHRFTSQGSLLQPGATEILCDNMSRKPSIHPDSKRELLERDRIDTEDHQKLNKTKPSAFVTIRDLVNTIAEYFITKDILTMILVNKQWNSFLKDTTNEGFPLSVLAERQQWAQKWVEKNAFGVEQWEGFFGSVERIPLPSPLKLYDILKEQSPIDPSKTVEQTHIFFLLPAKVNGEPLTLNSFKILIQAPKNDSKGYAINYNFGLEVAAEFGDLNGEACWVLMGKHVIPGSRNKSFEEQCQLIPQASSHCRYEVPSLLAATVCIVTHYVRTGERLYSDQPWTYTRCKEKVSKSKRRSIVGGFEDSGLRVCNYDFADNKLCGLAILRKV